MTRNYHKWYSNNLNRDIELLIYGNTGTKVIFFPTRSGRFYDYENWQLIEGIRRHIDTGSYQFICVDSIDSESFYSNAHSGIEKLNRHRSYENYIIKEVIPFVNNLNHNPIMMTAGCSMGAYHAVNIALRYPNLFRKSIGLSGRYDLTKEMGVFKDLLDGFYDLNIYFFMPSHFIPNIKNGNLLEQIKQIDFTLVIGRDDAFYSHNLDFNNLLLQKKLKSNLIVLDGEAHNFKFWKETLNNFL